ncbi:hypothetical protein Bccel_4714 [Pseudobacteroides cellulosolvens ATCC 35603 = DSM 2933]|uniref:Uncharacterized protein n=1 Tax=Pseudobacteroides cellulosolvens ATCC 35603 = DSM 2933 TaxID=398512 RepID=A0A0L6JUW0_9FIRM|nr:hypothetical protein Bccel_4714 [Pseudobacteroides cellulosolvens ATCC 35603 = DSM 2933]
MYSFEYDFYPKLINIDVNDFINNKLSFFLGSLMRNGQIVYQDWNIVQINNIKGSLLLPFSYHPFCKFITKHPNRIFEWV